MVNMLQIQMSWAELVYDQQVQKKRINQHHQLHRKGTWYIGLFISLEILYPLLNDDKHKSVILNHFSTTFQGSSYYRLQIHLEIVFTVSITMEIKGSCIAGLEVWWN